MTPTVRFLTFLVAACAVPASAQHLPRFENVAERAGVRFRPTFGDEDMSSILEATGSGCAFLDYDGDGFLDLYFVNGCWLPGISEECPGDCPAKHATDALYRNDGHGTFTDVTRQAGVGDPRYGMGVLVLDYDNDGDPDLYVTNYGRNTLYRNEGNGRFTDVTLRAGVGDTLWSVGATALDYDNDGWLDIYIGNYLDFDPEYRLYYAADEFPGPLAYPGLPDRLYRNNGDGTFTDVTAQAGVSNEGRAMGVVAADYDADGWVDIYVANDAMENYLYRNNGDGTFTERALRANCAFSESGNATSSMGGDFGDYDNDGDFDLLVPDMAYKSLYENDGNGSFQDATFRTGIGLLSAQYISWGGAFLDFDHDGWLDIFLANGDAHRLSPQEDLLLRNVPNERGGRRYVDIWDKAGPYFRSKGVGRGMAVGDYDNDGDLDVVVVNLDKPAALLRNDGPAPEMHWLMVALQGTRSNRDAVGAIVSARCGEDVFVRQRMVGNNYISVNDPRLHFGLGQHERVDELTIRWPSGTVQRLTNVRTDRMMTVVEPRSPTP